MERIVSEEFAEIIRKIPDREYDISQTTELMREYIGTLADRYGIVYMQALVTAPVSGYQPHAETKMIDLYHVKYRGAAAEKNYHFRMGNGGSVEILVGIREDTDWTQQQEQDVEILVKTVFLLMGRTQAMCDLKRVMTRDLLTNIPNRSGAYEYMKEKLQEEKLWDYCANYLNIRNMKLFNDRYNESIGNILLRKYAHVVEDYVGESGCAARLGEDNFFVLIKASRQEEFLTFLRELSVELAGRAGIPSMLKIDTRVGYYPIQMGDSIQDVMNCCSIALRYAKKDGNPDVMRYETSMRSRMLQMKQLEDDVPGAIEREEFAVYYQPKAYMPAENQYILCGAEALIRWFKDGSIISPTDFIPLLEKNGMVGDLDFYVLEHVCQDIKSWEEKGLTPVPVSVNFSRRHLVYDDIADRIMAVIRKYGVDTSLLEIEITESYNDEDLGALSKFEKKMHEYGIDVSMDDFGSGFSSLKMIKKIMCDTIKLDKSIVDGIGSGNKEDGIIISHIIRMIRELGKEIIAEGVESKEQAEFLRRNDCKVIQGFLYGRPMPWEAFEKRLENQ